MDKYIKIIFRDVRMTPIHLPIDSWKKILENDKALVPYKLPSETEWTGRVFNKSEVLSSEFDKSYSETHDKSTGLFRRKSDGAIVRMKIGELKDVDSYEPV